MKTRLCILCFVLLLGASVMATAGCPDDDNYDGCVNVKNCASEEVRVCAYTNTDEVYIVASQEEHIDHNESKWLECNPGPCQLKVGKMGFGTSCWTAKRMDGSYMKDATFKDGKMLGYPADC